MPTTTAAPATVTEMPSSRWTFGHKGRAPRRRLAVVMPALAVVVGLFIAGCGASSAGSSAGSARGGGYGAPASSPQVAAGGDARAPTTRAGAIPQDNGGDHDADNNGGPSDGDGNV
jgi:hypothetical protein